MQRVQELRVWAAARCRRIRLGPMDTGIFFFCLFSGRVVLAYGLSPLGPALFYGLCLNRRWELPGAMGALMGMLLFCRPLPPLLCGAVAGGVTARYLTGRLKKEQRVICRRLLPPAFGAIASLVFARGDAAGIILSALDLLLTVVLGPIYGMGIAALEKAVNRRRLHQNEQMALMVLWASGIFLFSKITVLGLDGVRVVCCGAVLTLAYYGGPMCGALGGIILGGCAALVGQTPLIIGGLAICGLCGALCREAGKLSCAVGFSLSSAVFIIFVENDGTILFPILEQVAGTGLLLLMPERIVGILSPVLLTTEEAARLIVKGNDRALRRQMGMLSGALFGGARAMERGEKSDVRSGAISALALHLNRLSRADELRLFREERRLESLLMDRGYGDTGVSVTRDGYGRRCVTLRVASCGGKRNCVKVLRRYVSEAMGQDYVMTHRPCRGGVENGHCTLEFAPGPKLTLEVAALGSVKPGMSRSGDTFLTADVGPGEIAAVLCDGMGSGPRAQLESRTAARLLLSFRRAGLGMKPMIQVVNGIMAAREEEVFSTGDMTVFDLTEKRCELIKMSAPPTFLLRGDQAHWISGKSLPIGAVPKASPFYARRRIEAGDTVVMVSDGVSDSFSGYREMGQELLRELQRDPSVDVMARRILTGARERMGERADDMTVAVIRIKSLC